MRTITVNVYEFDELNPSAKITAIEEIQDLASYNDLFDEQQQDEEIAEFARVLMLEFFSDGTFYSDELYEAMK